MGGDIDAEDLKWRLDTDFVKATVSFSKCLYSIQIFNENKAEVDSLFERLVSLTEVKSLMTRLTGLAASRAAAQKTSNELLLELENKQQELEIRFAGLVKAVEKALALKTQHADSVSSREPSGKDGGGSPSSTEENHSSNIGGQPVKLPYSHVSATSEAPTANAPAQRAVQLRWVLAEIFERAPEFGDALDEARGVCLKWQGIHPSNRRCKRGDKCPLLHVKANHELKRARNRCRAPFMHLAKENKILLVPPLKKAVQYWWRHTLQQETDCPVTGVDVLREGDSLVVLLTLDKPLPSSLAQDSSGKCWFVTEDGTRINASTAAIPNDRMWWHVTQMANFGHILRDSLTPGPQGKFKGVYSSTGWETCPAYGGQASFAFHSEGMIAKLSENCRVPEYIPEGVIGYFDAGNKRQWVHNENNLQLKYARIEYDTFCKYLSSALAELHGEHPYSARLHNALVNIAGLVVRPFEWQDEYDYDGPKGS